MFSQLNLSKTAQVYADAAQSMSSEAEVVPGKRVDFSKMMESIAVDTLTDIASCYYTSGSLNEDRADRALQTIKGRMAALRQMIASMQ